MHPEICKIGPLTIYSYGLALAVAFMLSSWLACKEAKKQGISPDLVYNFSFILIISGVAGARVFYVIENLSYYLRNPIEIIMLQRGGLSWFGGLFAAVICGGAYLKRSKLAILKTADLIVPFVAIAQAIGRIGCFFNGCCFGKTIIPVQIYSSLLLVIIFIILRKMQERAYKSGEIFFAYLFLYSIKRFFIEFLRLDNPVVSFGLTLFQLISIAVFAVSLFMLIRIKRQR